MNGRYELFETIERLTGKPLLESELDEICNLFDNTQNKSLRAENAKLMQLFEVSKMILSADSESPDGLLDCQDNDGDCYQSAFLAAALSKMDVLVRQIAEAHVTPDTLYAAAPEMLEALEDVWNDCEAAAKKGHAATFDAIRQRTFEKVKKSIAKAKPHP